MLHFDDKAIAKRGLDVDNYLISPNVNMQQLMETYLMYNKDNDYESNGLLFSEKHLCNSIDFAEPFFRKICSKEIKNIDKRIETTSLVKEKELLLSIKNMLEQRQREAKQGIIQIKKEYGIADMIMANEAMYQLDEDICLELLYNISDEERYMYI